MLTYVLKFGDRRNWVFCCFAIDPYKLHNGCANAVWTLRYTGPGGRACPSIPLTFHTWTSVSIAHSTDGCKTHIVKTIPPLRISRPSLGSAPDQKVKIPSFLKILATQSRLFLYALRASIDCILVLTVSMGMVVYTVMMPARPPRPNVLTAPSFSPGAT